MAPSRPEVISASPLESQAIPQVAKQLYIGGRWRDAADGAQLPVENPATGELICNVADADPDDALEALGAASEAQSQWADHPPRGRSEILRRAFELMTEQREDLALTLTLEMGKPLVQARAEVLYAAEFLRWYSEEAVRVDGRYMTAPSGEGRILVMKRPVGPSILITPWNFPSAMGTRKIGAAVAAGCTMVVKPAQQTPLSMLAIGQIFEEAGLPAGVLNIVTTSSAGPTMQPSIVDPRARKVSFTGSTDVGRELLRQSAEQVLRVSMELGGNDPFLVFEDADIDAAVDGALVAKLRNMGQSCTAANRFYIAEGVADEFNTKLVERFRALTIGPGTQAGVDVGPLIDARQRDKVGDLVDDALRMGAKVLLGGEPADGPGYFYPPTVLADVQPGSQLINEEIFGPVAPIITFDDEQDALVAANDTGYGLVAFVYTRDLDRALRISEQLDTGMVGLNTGLVSNPAAPFGGVKQSGIGREGGKEGIDEFLDVRYVGIKL